MTFKVCPICKLSLPLNILVPIIVHHQRKNIRVFICERCKKIKEQEAKKEKK